MKKALNSQISLNRSEIVSESEGNSVPLPQRTRKSYTDGKGNYHRGLEEELADIEAAISGGGEAAEGAASQSSATSEGTRGDVDSLRRQAALIRAEIARREQLKQEFRKKYNISEKGDISLDDLSRLFHDLNSDKAVGELFDNIRDVLKELGTDFRFTDRMDGVTGGVTKGPYNIDFFNWDLLVRDRDQQDKAGTFLHEMIHNISERLIQRYEDPSIGKLTKKQRELVEELQDIFAVVDAADLRHEDGTKMYGATEMREMLSELAKPWFREELDKIPYKGKQTVWQRIKQWFRDLIRNFVDVKEPTVLDRLDKVVDEILDTYGEEEIRDYRQDREHLGRMYDIAKKDLMDELEGTLGYVGPYEIVRGPEGERTLMGVHNISEYKLKKVLKAGGLANPSLAVIDTKKWILTAFDNSKTKKEKLSSVNTPGTPIDNSGSRAVAADDASLSEGKDTNNISNDQENIGKTSSI